MKTLQNETKSSGLYVYDQTRQALRFDPDVAGPVIELPEPWDLDEQHPPTLGEMIRGVASRITGPGTDTSGFLYTQQEFVNYLMGKEQQYGKEQEASSTDGDPVSEGGVDDSGHDPERAGALGASG